MSKHCLIVDDNDQQIQIIEDKIALIGRDVQFREARTRTEAIDILQGSGPIDLAVVDRKLTIEGHDEQGAQVIQSMRQCRHRKNVRTILITAYRADSETVAAELEVDALVSKLDDSWPQELQEAVRRLL